MTNKQEEVSHFIRLIRGISSQYLRYACTHGACHRFWMILKDRFPSARLYFTTAAGGGHCVAKIAGKYWDIWGVHDPKTDGAVRLPRGNREVERMASCFFDESFVLENPHIVREDDRRKPGGAE